MPKVLSTVMSPPIPRAKSRLIAKPSPTPSCVRVRSSWREVYVMRVGVEAIYDDVPRCIGCGAVAPR